MADELKTYGVNEVLAHEKEPPFSPVTFRGREAGSRDPNWQSRLGGSYLTKGFLQATHRGAASQVHDTSYIPSLAEGVDFGKTLKTDGKY
jgi:hypothetical protein